jgi:hypothetical protein
VHEKIRAKLKTALWQSPVMLPDGHAVGTKAASIFDALVVRHAAVTRAKHQARGRAHAVHMRQRRRAPHRQQPLFAHGTLFSELEARFYLTPGSKCVG